MQVNKNGNLVLFKINPDNFKLKVNLEGRRMKIYIKLDKADSEAYKNWKVNVCPSGMSDDDFAKSVFLQGIMKLHEEAEKRLQKYLDDNPTEKDKFLSQLKEISKEENVPTPDQLGNPVIISAL